MNNFGVIELASTKTTNAPGWAYVPDTRPGPHHAPTTGSRKRARTTAGGGNLSLADANARQEAKARREIEILDRDNNRDVQIPIPPKPGKARSAATRKFTPNVRRILQSQKTFNNHLDDYHALIAQHEANPAQAQAAAQMEKATNELVKKSLLALAKKQKQSAATEDTEMLDAPPRSRYLTPQPPLPSHPEDSNPLLASRIPPIPSDEELAALLAAPPLSYQDARGKCPDGSKYPARVFCAVCGYWGRVRCMKCGTRVCALDCLETHKEECVTRYGI
ncbi:hypothetical protein F5Y18DRAFT_384245 [Xylariaceae sp. FL1019]|nr:hypothetical protein F5Y18DRAFT_384245 [Xylariaceae sp. FL1019]